MKKLISVVTVIMILAGTFSVFVMSAGAVKYPRAGEMYMYARIDGIDGDASTPLSGDYMRWIDVISFEQGFEYVDGKMYTKLTFTHYLDCAVPAIQECCKKGTAIESADFHITSRVIEDFEENVIYNLHLENVIISSAVITGSSVDADGCYSYPVETVTLLAEISTSAAE